VHRAIWVSQQAMADAGEVLSRARLRAVHAAKIADETLISLTRRFSKQFIIICHNALPFYSLS
jgi:hypothetical protein